MLGSRVGKFKVWMDLEFDLDDLDAEKDMNGKE